MAGVSTWLARRGPRPPGGPGGPEYDPALPDEAQGGPGRRREASWEIHQRRQEERYQRLLGLLEQGIATAGGIFEALTKPPENDVLFSGSVLTRGNDVYFAELEFKQPAAFVAVYDSNGQGPITVTDSTSNLSPPSHGAGVFIVPQYGACGFPLRASKIALAASLGPGVISVVVLARPAPPFGSIISG